jgi:cell division protein FtsW (lipid II flippase)
MNMFKHILSQILIAIVAIATTLLFIDEFDWDRFLTLSIVAVVVVPLAIHRSYVRERKKRLDSRS